MLGKKSYKDSVICQKQIFDDLSHVDNDVRPKSQFTNISRDWGQKKFNQKPTKNFSTKQNEFYFNNNKTQRGIKFVLIQRILDDLSDSNETF